MRGWCHRTQSGISLVARPGEPLRNRKVSPWRAKDPLRGALRPICPVTTGCMRRKRTTSGRDQHDSAGALVLGYLGCLTVSAAAIATHTTSLTVAWFAGLQVLVALSAQVQRPWAALYNGVVAGMFYNFVFGSTARELSFDSAADLWLQASFVAVALLSCWAGGWVARSASRRVAADGPPPGVKPDLTWQARPSDTKVSATS
jgi:hypothetical protein